MEGMELWIMCGSFVLLLLLGVPVAFSIGLASVATVLAADLPMAIVFQKMVGGMQVFSFLAIPFFIFAGELMLHGGIAERIVVFANRLVGHVRGGLGMSNVVGCTLFGGVAGSPLADVSAMGSVMIPLMKREGYEVEVVADGPSALTAFDQRSADLVLLDLMLPGLPGTEVARELRARSTVPVIMLTAKDSEIDIVDDARQQIKPASVLSPNDRVAEQLGIELLGAPDQVVPLDRPVMIEAEAPVRRPALGRRLLRVLALVDRRQAAAQQHLAAKLELLGRFITGVDPAGFP